MGDFYDDFFGKENTLEYAREYANEVHDYKNSSRQVDNLLYKLRKEINTGDENKPSLMMRNLHGASIRSSEAQVAQETTQGIKRES